MRTRRLSPLVPLLLAGSLGIAACGGDDDDDSSDSAAASEPAVSADVVVTALDGIRWDNDSYSATAGDVAIELTNDSALPHTLAVIAEDGTKINGELQAASKGQEQTGTYALTAGTYKIICTVPGHGAMKADLNVS